MPASPSEDGAPRWMLYDPIRNQYFTLTETACQLLKQWQPGTAPAQFLQHINTTENTYSPEELEAFAGFLIANRLTEARMAVDVQQLQQHHDSQQRSIGQWLLHNYLFIRIPLVRPDAWLSRWIAHLDWLFSPLLHYLILTLGLLGIFMTVRQWDAFLGTFQYFFSIDGLLLYGLTLVVIKSAHELGHAFAAKRQGCRVSSMGIAFLVMFPVLYTDTTDAWRLTSSSKRLRIVTAGVRVELYLALLATFLWNMVPEGALKSVMFFVATTSWITSLLVNISPFLRFDGYYALSDWLGMENLQQRGFAVGRWALRKYLFGLHDPLPEPLSRSRTRLLIIYAWGTWLYRFFLFLGIALLVYHLFFKALGIFLFVVEILWFIVLPVWKEACTWWLRRHDFQPSLKQWLLRSVVMLLLMSAIVPLPSRIHIPAVLKAENFQTLFAPEDARVIDVLTEEGEWVKEGQLLITMTSEALDFELQQVSENIALIHTLLNRKASSTIERDGASILKQQLSRLKESQEGLESRSEKLRVYAPFFGRVTQLAELHPGIWMQSSSPLVSIMNPAMMEIEGYLKAQDIELTGASDHGHFIADNGQTPTLPVTLETIDISAAYSLASAELASLYNGSIAVRHTDNNTLVPEQELYHARLSVAPLEAAPALTARIPGTVVIYGDWNSWLWYHMRRITAILIRESGF